MSGTDDIFDWKLRRLGLPPVPTSNGEREDMGAKMREMLEVCAVALIEAGYHVDRGPLLADDNSDESDYAMFVNGVGPFNRFYLEASWLTGVSAERGVEEKQT